ncbi:hypothetical protein J4E82_010317 [Alternaria postmessia]|uniref:uncharacterized protein n=1 Tax=Alternaria postmessia TaxID=1187938 RepID=UPI002225B421|nr:uncharacterized protein J4E82_010317 [Alternaria postmessia]KAI5368862.1 hypothetical protein J4E82_010317 [Alternaria postmessia]
MKCDRVFPVCGRCQKTGRGHECTYDPRLLEESHSDAGAASIALAERPADSNPSSDSPDALQWKLRTQERRIAMLEHKLATRDDTRNPSRFEAVVPDEPEIKEEIMFRGKGFKSHFNGATSIMSMISMNYELQAFTREALTVDHSIMRVKTDFKTFRDQRKKSAMAKIARYSDIDLEVFAVLPAKSTVDAQVALYFQTWETSYRILHEPSFWKEYRIFWESDQDKKSSVSFAVLLLLLVAISKCLAPKDDVFIGDTTADRQAALELIDICDAWIGEQPRKRVTLSFFQLHCLSLLAKRVNCVRLKQDWIASGDLLRLSITSGMHRDPCLVGHGKISPFDEQMKKRLWVTVMEMELQSSIESGFQSGLTGLYFDTPAPANLADEAFSPDTQHVPLGQPTEYFTSASYLAMTLKSLPLRIHLTQLLNTPSSVLRYTDVLHYDAQIRSALAILPVWNDDSALVPSTLLRLQLRQYLLLLHKPYAKLAHTNDRYLHSFTTCVDTCSSLLAMHDCLISRGILALHNFRNDVIRIKSFTSYTAETETQDVDHHTHFADLTLPNRSVGPDSRMDLDLAILPQDPFLARTLCTSSIDILERTRQIFEVKVFRLASSLRSTMSTTRETGSTIGNAESAAPTSLDRLDMNLNLADGAKDMNGTFDVLQDMQVDMSGWSFPDFWAFDLGGDF